MVYLLKMGGSFHGYVGHNQMVNLHFPMGFPMGFPMVFRQNHRQKIDGTAPANEAMARVVVHPGLSSIFGSPPVMVFLMIVTICI